VIGEPVALRGGTFVVESVREATDPMSTMHQGKGGIPAGATKSDSKATSNPNGDAFANMGMAGMSQQSADPVPAGHRRIRVDIALRAGDLPLRVGPNDLTVVDGTGKVTKAHSSKLGDGPVAPGMELAGTALFDVPTKATGLTVQARGAQRGVAIAGSSHAGTHSSN